jgi:transposase-like protein
MRKKHNYLDRLKYMSMLENGYSYSYIATEFGIDHSLLEYLYHIYQKDGPSALLNKTNTKATAFIKQQAVLDFEENHLSLVEVMLKYDISKSALKQWRKKYHLGGIEALKADGRGRQRKNMGRPKKKSLDEMTELERLQYRVKYLEAENALLKKVKALVEEREARLLEIGRKPSKD